MLIVNTQTLADHLHGILVDYVSVQLGIHGLQVCWSVLIEATNIEGQLFVVVKLL